MTTDLNFTSSTTEPLLGRADYNINQSAGTDVTLKFTLPSTLDNDTINSNAVQTLNFSILNLTHSLSASSPTGGATSENLNGDILINNGTITAYDSANIAINTKLLVGDGMSFIGGSTMTVKGVVGYGQTFNVGFFLSGFFIIDNPRTFFGDINLSPGPFTPSSIPEGTVDLVGLAATSYDYANDVLTLWNGNRVVDRLRLSSANLTVSQWQDPDNSPPFPSGVIVSTEPPFGTLLPVHSMHGNSVTCEIQTSPSPGWSLSHAIVQSAAG
jgi:hypothetical protein